MPSPLAFSHPLLPPLRGAAAAGRAVWLVLLPAGGQLGSRRNAWSAMSLDAGRARARREAAAAFAVAVAAPSLEEAQYAQQ